jgi:CelD/BcsL family acetyltransferase involved in cellulose biosynthesis
MSLTTPIPAALPRERQATAIAAGLRVERLTTMAQFRALHAEWDDLLARARGGTVFQTWEWAACWYEHFEPRADLLVLTVRDVAGRLVAVAPCSRSTALGGAFRMLYLLGRGKELTEYVDAVIDQDYEREAAQAITAAWHRERACWDVFTLAGVPADGPLAREVLTLAGTRGYRVQVREQVGVARALPESWEAFYASLGRNMKKHIRKFANRLHREGHQEELVLLDGPERVEQAIDLFLDLHRKRSQAESGRRHTDRFAAPEREAFLRAVARRFSARGEFWPCVLEVDGVPVAIQLCFVHRGTLYPYYSGYDPAWAQYGVMMNLFRRCIERGIQHGCTRLDMMLGMDQEKLRWGGAPRPVIDISLAAPHPRSQAAFAILRARRAAKPYLARLLRRRGAAQPEAHDEDEQD